MSHPSRVRGLKLWSGLGVNHTVYVAPFTGAWIEINEDYFSKLVSKVAPFTGAWIEITVKNWKEPSEQVAPFTGAWIEIL